MNKNLIAFKLMHHIYNNPMNLPKLHQQVLNGDPFTRFDDNCGVDIVVVKNGLRSVGANISTDDTPISWAALPAILAIGLDANYYHGKLDPTFDPTVDKGYKRARYKYLNLDLNDATTCAILIDDVTDEPDITVYMATNEDWDEVMNLDSSSTLYHELGKRFKSDGYDRKVMKIGLIDDNQYSLRSYNDFQAMVDSSNVLKNEGYVPLIMIEAVDDDEKVELIYWMVKPSKELGYDDLLCQKQTDESEKFNISDSDGFNANGGVHFDFQYGGHDGDDGDDEDDEDDDDDD